MSGILRANGVCKYFGGLKAVENVDMEIARGDIFGIIGPNGAGKTTFFNICTGIYGPTKGSVYLEEEEITGLSPDKVAAKGMARTFQNIRLFGALTVFDNVLIAKHMRARQNFLSATFRLNAREERRMREEAMALLEEQNLAHLKDEVAGSLPYGLQRRLEIARALATSPRLLLLDEPAAGMNSKEKEELNELLYRIIDRGVSILIIEHDMKLMMGVADYLYVLNYGKLLAEGTTSEIQTNPEVIKAYLGGDE